jgi:hypothetical protein
MRFGFVLIERFCPNVKCVATTNHREHLKTYALLNRAIA